MLKRLDNIGIAVRDIQRSMAFYTEQLGLAGQAHGTEGSVQVGDLSLYLFQTQAPDAGAVGRTADYLHDPVGIDHLAFEVEDIARAGAELEAKGIVFAGPVVGDPGQFRYRGFSDPDGNMLYIIQK